MVIMNMEEYDRQTDRIKLYSKLAIAEQQIADGAEGEDFMTVAYRLRKRVLGRTF